MFIHEKYPSNALASSHVQFPFSHTCFTCLWVDLMLLVCLNLDPNRVYTLHSTSKSLNGFLISFSFLHEIDLLKKLSTLSCELPYFLDIADCIVIKTTTTTNPCSSIPCVFPVLAVRLRGLVIFRLYVWQDNFVSGVLSFHQERYDTQLSMVISAATEDRCPDPEFA